LVGVDEFADRGLGAVELCESTHQGDELSRLQEHQSSGDVVVCEGAERLIAQRHLRAERPGSSDVEGVERRKGHGLVDAAETVDGDLFDE
jgi:hypothetical protein